MLGGQGSTGLGNLFEKCKNVKTIHIHWPLLIILMTQENFSLDQSLRHEAGS